MFRMTSHGQRLSNGGLTDYKQHKYRNKQIAQCLLYLM